MNKHHLSQGSKSMKCGGKHSVCLVYKNWKTSQNKHAVRMKAPLTLTLTASFLSPFPLPVLLAFSSPCPTYTPQRTHPQDLQPPTSLTVHSPPQPPTPFPPDFRVLQAPASKIKKAELLVDTLFSNNIHSNQKRDKKLATTASLALIIPSIP